VPRGRKVERPKLNLSREAEKEGKNLMAYEITMKRPKKQTLMRFLLISLFLIAGCVSTYGPTVPRDENLQNQISTAVLHVGIEQKATGKVGKYGFQAYVCLSEHPQIVGIDPRDELMEKYGKENLAKYTNSDYVRFGSLLNQGRQLGKLILADKTGNILTGTFWDSFDVTSYLRMHGNRTYYLATVARIDRKTYAAVGVRCYLEVSTIGGKRARSNEVYFIGRTESMVGYLAREVPNVGLEISFDIPSTAGTQD
jgi:hypothetical protein